MISDPQTCPICGGHMECIHQSTDTWECDTCDYIVGESTLKELRCYRMTDKKITDEDIISSLEIIATTRNCNECKIRNCKWGTCNCEQITANAALDLINRQKTEIEKLKKEKDEYAYLYDKHVNTAFSHIKAEAVKEFADRLEENISDGCHIVSDEEYCGFDCGDIHKCIDNLLKEMVGDDNA